MREKRKSGGFCYGRGRALLDYILLWIAKRTVFASIFNRISFTNHHTLTCNIAFLIARYKYFCQGKDSRWTEAVLVVYIHYTIAVKHLTAFQLLSGKLEKPTFLS